ncbi:MAG: hypothetical protein HZB22_02085 [Deltaproteobacteria bacterium]|nr:hypothetical protein [Deltaproteobacteria bacterium]
MKKKLYIGQVVMIYQDPFTEQKEEGMARLLHFIRDWKDGTEQWEVRMMGARRKETNKK